MTQMMLQARQAHSAGRFTLSRLLVENGLSLVLLGLFALSWIGQTLTGWRTYNQEQVDRGQPTTALRDYVFTGHFLEATSENWESEFLQLSAFVWLTAFLFQKGSPESKDPYEPEEAEATRADSPWPARRGGWVLRLYECSLSLTMFVLFLICFCIHAATGARAFSQEQIAHGQSGVTTWQYMGSSQFWFESLQNWQSEFLSIAAMVLLGIFLRQKGSPESKKVQTPHWQNE